MRSTEDDTDRDAEGVLAELYAPLGRQRGARSVVPDRSLVRCVTIFRCTTNRDG